MKRLLLNTYSKLLLLIISTSIFFAHLSSLYLYTIKEEEHFYKTTYDQYDKEVKSLLDLTQNILWLLLLMLPIERVGQLYKKRRKWYKYIESEFDSYEVDYIGVYGLDKK
jgi:hypothetical protein